MQKMILVVMLADGTLIGTHQEGVNFKCRAAAAKVGLKMSFVMQKRNFDEILQMSIIDSEDKSMQIYNRAETVEFLEN